MTVPSFGFDFFVAASRFDKPVRTVAQGVSGFMLVDVLTLGLVTDRGGVGRRRRDLE